MKLSKRATKFFRWGIGTIVIAGLIMMFLMLLGLWIKNYNLAVGKHNIQVLTEVRQCYKDFSAEGAKVCAERANKSKLQPVHNIWEMFNFTQYY